MSDYYQKRIAIVQAVRRSVHHFSHYQDINGRIIPYILDELEPIKEKDTTDYQVLVDIKKERWGKTYSIKVYGSGIFFHEAVRLFWTEHEFPQWQDGLQYALNVADMSDYQEREQEEEKILPSLQVLEQMIKDSRNKARELIGVLPVPSLASVRKDSVQWSSPSAKLVEQFPNLFKRMEK